MDIAAEDKKSNIAATVLYIATGIKPIGEIF